MLVMQLVEAVVLGPDLVVDAVAHPYNLAPTNWDTAAHDQLETVHRFHELCHDPANAHYALTADEFFTDFDVDVLAHALFAESPVDVAVLHALPNLGFTKGKITEPSVVAELRDRYPHRFRLYGTVETPLVDAAIGQLEQQVRDHHIDGLKVYPAFYYDGSSHGWRLDGEDFATPLLQAASDLGITNVAIHKTLYMPPAPKSVFRVEDMEGALERYPHVNFQIVHAGAAFVPQTAELLGRHTNLSANLESTVAYLLTNPDLFAEVLGTFLTVGTADQLLFGSGANLMHPRPLFEAFAAWQMPARLVEEKGYPEITPEVRKKILGGNALRLYGLDPDQVRVCIQGDAFEREKADGYAPPWALLRPVVAGQLS